jgi:chromosomal replication initiation ATPase DnaA
MFLAPPEWYDDQRLRVSRREAPPRPRSEARVALPPTLAELQQVRREKNTAEARKRLAKLAAQKRTLEAMRIKDPHDPTDPLERVRKSSYARQEIFQATLAAFGMDESELMTKSRDRKSLQPRQAAAYLMKTMTTASFPDIGLILARDHTTIMHSCEMVKNQWETYAPFVAAIEAELPK